MPERLTIETLESNPTRAGNLQDAEGVINEDKKVIDVEEREESTEQTTFQQVREDFLQ